MRPLALEWEKYSDRVMSAWFDLLSREPEEEEVQQFLELHPSMVPGGSGDIGPGGITDQTWGLYARLAIRFASF